MIRFAANLTYLFREAPFLDRFQLAAAAGFGGVEFHFPYEHRWTDVRGAADAAGVQVVQSSVASGDRSLGDWGLAAVPGQGTAFRESVRRTLAFAAEVGIGQVHAPSGVVGPEHAWRRAWDTYIENLTWAAEESEGAGVRLLIEPINDRDTPCYFLSRTGLARQALDRVGSPNLMLQFDCYHAAAMGEEPASAIPGLLPRLGHVQISGYPGRHEPDGRQDIDYPSVFRALAAGRYDGWVGCEFRPTAALDETLRQLRRDADGLSRQA